MVIVCSQNCSICRAFKNEVYMRPVYFDIRLKSVDENKYRTSNRRMSNVEVRLLQHSTLDIRYSLFINYLKQFFSIKITNRNYMPIDIHTVLTYRTNFIDGHHIALVHAHKTIGR